MYLPYSSHPFKLPTRRYPSVFKAVGSLSQSYKPKSAGSSPFGTQGQIQSNHMELEVSEASLCQNISKSKD